MMWFARRSSALQLVITCTGAKISKFPNYFRTISIETMNIALGISATAAAMGYLVYSSKSQSIVSLKGKTVLITGAGSGVGRLTALQFAKEGCSNLVLWDLNAMGMKETQELILKVAPGVRICTAVVDVSSTKAVYEAAKNANAWASPSYVSVLINNAGIVSGKPLLETEDSKISKTFQVNVLAHFWTTKAFLPKMISEKFGHVVTVASIAGLTAAPKMVDYGTTFVFSFSKSDSSSESEHTILYTHTQRQANTELWGLRPDSEKNSNK